MLICLAAPRPATAELAQIRNADLNLIDLARSTHPPTTSAIRSRTSISPLDRLASTHTPSPRRSNPHSARGTATPSLIAVSSLGGFPTPALRARGTVIIGPASENLHSADMDGSGFLPCTVHICRTAPQFRPTSYPVLMV